MRPLEPVSRLASRYHAQTSARGDEEIVVNAAKLAEYGRRLSGRREPLGRDSSLDSGWLPGMDSNSASQAERVLWAAVSISLPLAGLLGQNACTAAINIRFT